MNCQNVDQWFDDFLRNGPDSIPARVASHIAQCPVCAKRMSQWGVIAREMQSAPARKAPLALKARILRAIAAQTNPTPATRAAWQPISAWGWSFALAAVIVATAVAWWIRRKPAQTLPAAAMPGLVIDVMIPGASKVTVAGDFNGWNAESHPLQQAKNGRWTLTVHPGSGVYEYLLLVDGEKWMLDPGNPVRVPDGFGGFNSGVVL